MGSKTSCQGPSCSQESIGVCRCSNERFCRDCYNEHKFKLAQVVHELVGPSGATLPDEEVPISMKTITLTKLIYRSPDGATEVHEGSIKYKPGRYAIKIMYCMNEADLAKKQKESEIQRNVKHSNICECITSFRDDSYTTGCRFVIVLEFSEDGDIEQESEKRKLKKNPWTEAELMTHFRELIEAFKTMQDVNLTHGDIKPRNLYLAKGGKIKIGDFGESKQSMQALVTQTYQVTGTVIYFSPLLFEAYLNIIKGKNLKGQVRHNPIKSDVFSLGLSFMHMASLNKPSELNNLEHGADALQNSIDRAVNKLQYSDSLKQLLLNMLQVQESKRYDFKQLQNYLNPSLTKETSVEEAPKLGKQSTMRAAHPLLVSLTQAQGNAAVLDSKFKTIKLKSHRFQSSSRAVIIGDSVIVSGGLKNSKFAFKINISTCAATKLQEMNKGRAWHTMLVHSHRLFVIGGRDEEKKTLSECESINCLNCEILNEIWNPEESLEIGRENATAVSLNDSIFIFGGVCKSGNKWVLTDTIERFRQNAWQKLETRLNPPASCMGIVAYTDNEIWLVGGSLEKGNLAKSVSRFGIEDDGLVRVNEESKEVLEEEDFFSSVSAFKCDNGDVVMLGNHENRYHLFERANSKWTLVMN